MIHKIRKSVPHQDQLTLPLLDSKSVRRRGKGRGINSNALNLSGQRFGRLIVLHRAESRSCGSGSRTRWMCKCDCGAFKSVDTSHLRGGDTVSCGCYIRSKSASHLPKKSLNRKTYGESAFRSVYKRYIRHAEKRGLSFHLSMEEFKEIATSECFYCDAEPSIEWGGGRRAHRFYGSFAHNTVDRLDNSLSYTRENCVPACWVCNRAKGVMSYEKFLAWIRKTHEWQVSPVRRELGLGVLPWPLVSPGSQDAILEVRGADPHGDFDCGGAV